MTYQPPEKKEHNVNVRLTPELYAALEAAFPRNRSDGLRYILREYFKKKERSRANKKGI